MWRPSFVRAVTGATLGLGSRPFASQAVSTASLNLSRHGIDCEAAVYHNLSYDDIFKHEVDNNEGTVTSNGTFAVSTGEFTGRSPADKWLVQQGESADNIWWGNVNQPITPEVFDDLRATALNRMNAAEKLYVFDGYCGTTPASRKKCRFVTEIAWQHHFVTNMFIRPETEEEIEDFDPDFTIINACQATNNRWEHHGLNSDVFVAFNVEDSLAVIGGTWYGGEMKKGMFSMMNYWLPLEGTVSMHCSANVGAAGDTALFFGLSGTGKTTLSADADRRLIGDDEHGWDDEGIFNFEGGCYAKTANLAEHSEPEIFRAVRRNALLENVVINDGEVDYTDMSVTENGRVSYPLFHIDNFEPSGRGGHPDSIIFLACDAFGVLPPVSRLNEGQAMYHFLSGYTAKVAGTERGMSEPTVTFSACFGAAFLTLHPTKYADILKKKMRDHNSTAYLVNTGWVGGAPDTGADRMPLEDTRKCVTAILDGTVAKSEFLKDPVFGFDVPTAIPGVDESFLDPRNAWSDKGEYDKRVRRLAKLFQDNFQQYVMPGMTDYSSFGPTV